MHLCEKPKEMGRPHADWASTGVGVTHRLCGWHSKNLTFKLNSIGPPKKRGFEKSSFANRAFRSAGRPFSWVGEALAVGFDSSGLLGWPAGRPDGRQLRRQSKCNFQGILEAAGRKRFYANGEPLSPHL